MGKSHFLALGSGSYTLIGAPAPFCLMPGAKALVNEGSPPTAVNRPPGGSSSASAERAMKSEALSVSRDPNILRSTILTQPSRLQHAEELHARLCVGSLSARPAWAKKSRAKAALQSIRIR